MLAIYKRELKAYFHGITGMLFIGILLLFAGFMVFTNNLYGLSSSVAYTLYTSEIILILIVPVLCMRSMAEDRHNKTDMFLLTLPVKTSSIVIGKYLALLTVYAIPVALISLYPLVLGLYGEINYVTTYTSILGFFLLGAALIAMCQFLSALTESQVIAAVIGIAATFALFSLNTIASFIPSSALASFIGFAVLGIIAGLITYFTVRNLYVALAVGLIIIVPFALIFIFASDMLDSLFPTVLTLASPFTSFETITTGLFDIAAIGTLISHIVFFVFLTNQSMDKRRWA
ncbi:MAG: ABC transporter permease [Clostridia bacterium]|nr:ABC transporter permease [Clostridia bacterium]